MAERMGERGEPWGVPSETRMRSPVSLLKDRATVLLVKKDSSQLQNEGGKPKRWTR